jgi:hypothetical protein
MRPSVEYSDTDDWGGGYIALRRPRRAPSAMRALMVALVAFLLIGLGMGLSVALPGVGGASTSPAPEPEVVTVETTERSRLRTESNRPEEDRSPLPKLETNGIPLPPSPGPFEGTCDSCGDIEAILPTIPIQSGVGAPRVAV